MPTKSRFSLFVDVSLVLLMRIERTTSPLPRECSATELQEPFAADFGWELRRSLIFMYKQVHVGIARLAFPAPKSAEQQVVRNKASPHLQKLGAGERDRTVVCSLEGCRSTIELLPHDPHLQFTSYIRKNSWWRELDSNQRTRKRADLQSAAINHSAISPKEPAIIQGFRSIVNGIRRINAQLNSCPHFYCTENPVFCARKISTSCSFN
jgi:hypothetical protein